MNRKFLLIIGPVFVVLMLSTSAALAQPSQPLGTREIQDTYSIYLPLVDKGVLQSTWKPVSGPNANDLKSVSMLTASSGFAVGQAGTIIRWDGTNWTPADSPISSDLSSVSLGDASNGWALSGMTILRWDGISWKTASGAPNIPFQGVDAVGNKAWVVGGTLLCNPSCTNVTSPIAYWNGSSWSTTFSSDKYLYSVDMISELDGFAVGDYMYLGNPKPAIVRWNGSSWVNQTHPAVRGLNDISAFDSNSAWAVGMDLDGVCTLLRWNGSAWSAYPCPEGVSSLSAISMGSPNDAWAVGEDDIIHWDGSIWSRLDISVPAALKDIDMLSASDGWAVGDNGTILHFSP